MLDIRASNQVNPTNSDGILIPRIDVFPSADPELEQNGMLVFLTSGDSFYFWKAAISSWIALSENEDEASVNHYVGELYGGGIVFYVYNNGKNGLIARQVDLNGGAKTNWSDALSFGSDYIGNNGNEDWRLPNFLE